MASKRAAAAAQSPSTVAQRRTPQRQRRLHFKLDHLSRPARGDTAHEVSATQVHLARDPRKRPRCVLAQTPRERRRAHLGDHGWALQGDGEGGAAWLPARHPQPRRVRALRRDGGQLQPRQVLAVVALQRALRSSIQGRRYRSQAHAVCPACVCAREATRRVRAVTLPSPPIPTGAAAHPVVHQHRQALHLQAGRQRPHGKLEHRRGQATRHLWAGGGLARHAHEAR